MARNFPARRHGRVEIGPETQAGQMRKKPKAHQK
jgi:hypothetical protein